MINKNVADYTNFSGKTNKRIMQAPGGSSSLSLGWDNPNQQSSRQSKIRTNHLQNQFGSSQKEQSTYNNAKHESYEEPVHVMSNAYEKEKTSNFKGNSISYDEPYTRQQQARNNDSNSSSLIGGKYGYNNYNIINHQNNNSYEQNYPQDTKYPPKPQSKHYENDQQIFYKLSSNSYKNIQNEELDFALEQQKHKIQSNRSSRNQNKSSNIIFQQSEKIQQEGKSCVKIVQKKDHEIFGNQYDYWKQDGHDSNKNNTRNSRKEPPYLYEKNNQLVNQNKSYQPQRNLQNQNTRNEKTFAKVHNPPGGKTNFIFG